MRAVSQRAIWRAAIVLYEPGVLSVASQPDATDHFNGAAGTRQWTIERIDAGTAEYFSAAVRANLAAFW
jgi:hypothetical protein